MGFKDTKVKIKRKIDESKSMASYRFHKTVEWCEEHKSLLIALAPVAATAISGTTKVVSSVNKKNAVKKDEELKKNYVYDHSAGMYVRLKRPMTEKDWKNLTSMKSAGLTTSEALMAMNMVK